MSFRGSEQACRREPDPFNQKWGPMSNTPRSQAHLLLDQGELHREVFETLHHILPLVARTSKHPAPSQTRKRSQTCCWRLPFLDSLKWTPKRTKPTNLELLGAMHSSSCWICLLLPRASTSGNPGRPFKRSLSSGVPEIAEFQTYPARFLMTPLQIPTNVPSLAEWMANKKFKLYIYH